jgi:purine-binding chemotaxis protein CheW
LNAPQQLVVFSLEDFRYAVSLSSVERTVRAVEITPLPKAPEIVTGVINLAGVIVPVLNIRRRFRLPEREVKPGDQFLIACTASRVVALVVDEVRGTTECSSREMIEPEKIIPGMEFVTGVVKLADGMLFIHDLDRFLSLEEEKELETAINGENGHV